MYKLSIILLAVLNNEEKNSVDFTIAKYILDNVDNLKNISVMDLSNACHVSKSTISRFCRKIGLNDFLEIRQELYNVNFYRDEKFNYKLNDGNESYVLKVANQLIKLHNVLDYTMIDKLVKDIYNFPRVVIVGHMQSYQAAINLQENLFVSRKITVCPSAFSLQLNYFKNCNKDDLIIVFSNEGEFFERIFARKTEITELREPKVYFITSNKKVKNYNYTDEIIWVPDNNNLVSHPIQFNLISDIISIAYGNYCKEIEES